VCISRIINKTSIVEKASGNELMLSKPLFSRTSKVKVCTSVKASSFSRPLIGLHGVRKE
jgi:hypothetical protein